MTEMIDRISRVIGTGNDTPMARAVIREMSVPSPEMLVAAASLSKTATSLDIWTAMAEAAAR